MGTLLRGWALAEQGQGEEGIAQIRKGLAGMRAAGTELATPYHLALLAETYGRGGQAGEGLTLVDKALAIAGKNEERFYEAELYRLKGELTLRMRDPSGKPKVEEAEVCFHQALVVARHQQAKSLELRAATSLARLWHSQGKTADARALLVPVYDWFTEGFDTRDLKDAKALLDELA